MSEKIEMCRYFEGMISLLRPLQSIEICARHFHAKMKAKTRGSSLPEGGHSGREVSARDLAEHSILCSSYGA